MRILIIRHADPEYDGDTLTAAGHAEAEALARRLCRPQQEGAGRLSKLFSSPMGRARTTAAYTEKLAGLQAETLHWTRELTYWPRLGIEQRPGEGGMALWDVSGEVRGAQEITLFAENSILLLVVLLLLCLYLHFPLSLEKQKCSISWQKPTDCPHGPWTDG
jgi:Histidine phosphatase superfamily (branch 1)